MKIEIVDKNGSEITSFDLDSNPFKIGEVINIDIKNHDNSFWDKKELYKEYRIEKINHFLRQIYGKGRNYNSVFVVSVRVSEIENPVFHKVKIIASEEQLEQFGYKPLVSGLIYKATPSLEGSFWTTKLIRFNKYYDVHYDETTIVKGVWFERLEVIGIL